MAPRNDRPSFEFAMQPRTFTRPDPRSTTVYLARSAAFLQCVGLRRPSVPKSVFLPLRILVVSGTSHAHPALRIDEEVNSLRNAFGRVRNIAVDVLTNPTLSALNAALDAAGAGHFDILHYIGHGRCNRDNNGGTLSFAGKRNSVHSVHPNRFAAVVRNRGIQLVVLTASDGERAGPTDPFAGVARDLTRVVPAVIAMPFGVHDFAAIAFSAALYVAVANGLPIDEAVSQAQGQPAGGRKPVESAMPRTATGKLLFVAQAARTIEAWADAPAPTVRTNEPADDEAEKSEAQQGADDIAANTYGRPTTDEPAAPLQARRLSDKIAATLQAQRLADDEAAKVQAQRLADEITAKVQAHDSCRRDCCNGVRATGVPKTRMFGASKRSALPTTRRQNFKRRARADEEAAQVQAQRRGGAPEPVPIRRTTPSVDDDIAGTKTALHRSSSRRRKTRIEQSSKRRAMSMRIRPAGELQRSAQTLNWSKQLSAALLIIAGIAAAVWSPTSQDRRPAGRPTMAGLSATEVAPIQAVPGEANTYFNRGVAHYSRGDYEWAIDDYTRAIALKPDYAVAYNNRGIAYDNRGIAYDNVGAYGRAIADYTHAIALRPDYALAYYNRAVAYKDKGDQRRAIADYTRAIKLKPDYAEAHNGRGLVYASQAEYTHAIADYNRALQLKPDDSDVYKNRASAFDSRGDHDGAIADFTRALQLKPNDEYAYNDRGSAYDSKGDHGRAIADFSRALQLKPDDAEASSNLERVHGKSSSSPPLMAAHKSVESDAAKLASTPTDEALKIVPARIAEPVTP